MAAGSIGLVITISNRNSNSYCSFYSWSYNILKKQKGENKIKYYKEYQEWLDEIQPIHNGLPYSILLERGDPIAFNCGYDDFLNANDLEDE